MARKMKDSGIEWIGEIPEGWELTKVKRIFDIGRGRVISQQELTSVGYPVYSSQTKNNGCLGYISTYDFDKSQLTWTTDGVNAGTVFLREGKHNCTNVCGTLAPKNDTNDLRYLKYALEYIAFYHKRADINGFKIMNNEMAEIELLLPPLFEQQNIANYLDFKCSQTQSILEQSLFSIEEYKKLKQAVITQAVTKGVRGEREMKDSGVEWIGEIPEEWNKCKLKNISIDIGDGLHGTPKFDDSGEVYFINGNNFSSEYVEPKFDTKKLCLEESLNYPKPELTEQTIMISLNGSYGKVCLYRYFPMLLGKSAGYITLLPSINRRYVRYYLSSTPAQIIMTLSLNGTTIPNLSLNTLYNFPTILPPASEQAEIADYLDAKCAEIDGLIAKKEQLVKELESYKKSLIYEVVTGKREIFTDITRKFPNI